MEASGNLDYLICMSLETTRSQDDYRTVIEAGNQDDLKIEELVNDNKFPNIIEMNWIAYCLNDMKPDKEQSQYYVKPTNMEQLNVKTTELTGVKQDDIAQAQSLESVIAKFNNYVSNSFVLKNKSYRIITFGTWELGIQLHVEAIQKRISLAEHFVTYTHSALNARESSMYIDVIKEFRLKYPENNTPILKIDHLLEAMKLKRRHDVIKSSKVSEILCTNIVRVVHRLCKEGHVFVSQFKSGGIPTLNSIDTPNLASICDEDDRANVESGKDLPTHPTPKEESVEEAKEIKKEVPTISTPPAVFTKQVVHEEIKQPPVEEYKYYPQEDVNNNYDSYYNRPSPVSNAYPMPHSGAPSMGSYYDSRARERATYPMDSRGSSGRERSPEPPHSRYMYSEDNTIKYIRVRNLPPNCDKVKITEFFNTIPIAYANIVLEFDNTGRFNQQAILALNNLNDQIEALSQSGRYIFNYQIEVYEATANDWELAQRTQTMYSKDDKILVRMRGLPYNITKQDILMFFSGYDIMPDSVIIGEMNNGKKTGEGVILFKNEQQAEKAVSERNGATIGKRWIELYLHPYSHFHSFFQAQNHEEYVVLSKYINDENRSRTVRMRGLPYGATKKDIVTFFRDFGVMDNDVVIEVKDSRATGRAIVFLSDSMAAMRATQLLDKEYIGNRYIELEQVSNLPHEF